jgi:hypothetical protein
MRKLLNGMIFHMLLRFCLVTVYTLILINVHFEVRLAYNVGIGNVSSPVSTADKLLQAINYCLCVFLVSWNPGQGLITSVNDTSHNLLALPTPAITYVLPA